MPEMHLRLVLHIVLVDHSLKKERKKKYKEIERTRQNSFLT